MTHCSSICLWPTTAMHSLACPHYESKPEFRIGDEIEWTKRGTITGIRGNGMLDVRSTTGGNQMLVDPKNSSLSFTVTKRAKPDEPKDWGSVIEARAIGGVQQKWQRENTPRWKSEDGMYRYYSDLIDVTVLRVGV